jgi:hypothetical protein
MQLVESAGEREYHAESVPPESSRWNRDHGPGQCKMDACQWPRPCV